MKVFISADIEGVTTTTNWSECDPSHPSYARHAEQMTREVAAACEGANAAGATQIYVKDAHGGGLNINIAELPENATLIRASSGHPYCMVEGIDQTFDACMFVGYHSAAGRCGNPLSHTFTTRNIYTKLNGRLVSEFMLYSRAAALEGVPTVFLAGDRMLCEDYRDLHPSLVTVPVKDGIGALTMNTSPRRTLAQIRDGAKAALLQDLSRARVKVEGPFTLELCYKEHTAAVRCSYYPGVTCVSDNTLLFESDSYFEVLRALMFLF